MHLILVDCLGGQSLPRNSVISSTITKQQQIDEFMSNLAIAITKLSMNKGIHRGWNCGASPSPPPPPTLNNSDGNFYE